MSLDFLTKRPQDLNTTIHEDIDNLVKLQAKILERTPKPFIFGQTRNTEIDVNQTAGIVVYRGNQMPAGHKGVIKDININFSTVGGTIILVKINYEGTVISDITRSITGSVSGIGNVILQPGEALGISVQVAGAGIIGVNFSGDIVKIE